ncbi:hypothetical protein Syun_020631 [Stephania yunnanensis]|uniref:Secreted protein n=1 Tax=Stephania yunnanensis TaxID=152371 RepID=A0AAP0IE49_9MAGN
MLLALSVITTPFPSLLLTLASSATAARLILDFAAGLHIHDFAARVPTLPSAELHPGGLTRRHSRLVDCLATRRWTFESQSQTRSDDQPGHLTTNIALSQSAHLDDHQPGHWTDPHRRMFEDRHHLLDDHDELMSQLMPPSRPPPRQ